MKKILVTGGLGFIGSHLVDRLISNEKSDKSQTIEKNKFTTQKTIVHVLDALKEGSDLANKNDQAIYHTIDLIHENKVRDLIFNEQFDQIYHLAAESHVDRAIHDTHPFIESNITGCYHLFRAIAESSTKLKTKVLLFSTDELMGELKSGYFSETDPTLPKNLYSMTKQAQEAIARSFFYSDELQVVTIRCSNVYGPRQKEKLIPVTISSILSGKKIPVYGTGAQIREWTYVSDAVDGAVFVMEHGKIGEVYHIGSGVERTNISVVEEVLKRMVGTSKLKHEYYGQTQAQTQTYAHTHTQTQTYTDQIQFVTDRKGHDFRYALSLDKIHGMGWKAKVSFEEGIQKTIDWYQN